MVLLAAAAVILICAAAEKISGKLGLPALVLFMAVGMLFGIDGPLHIYFENYELTEKLCSTALLFIMFFGGFNLKWKWARPIWKQAVLLATLGVLITAAAGAGIFHLITSVPFLYCFLICSILGSTDAASIFSVLKKQKLNLKDNTASLLEVESGANDPVSYMLTIFGIQLVSGQSADGFVLEIFLQLGMGLLIGAAMAYLTIWLYQKSGLISSDLSILVMIGLVLMCYALAGLCMGNAYLAVYLMGVLCGNHELHFKKPIISFFDGITSVCQVLIFFILGLLATPSLIPQAFPYSMLLFVILLVLARPLAVWLILKPFKAGRDQILLVSFAGLRGAASCVFAVMAVAAGVSFPFNLFQIVFVVCLLSVAIQGFLFPKVCSLLNMVDETGDVGKTFNDYTDETSLTMLRVYIQKNHPWAYKNIQDIQFAPGSLALMIIRNGQCVITRGKTQVLPGDLLVLSIEPYHTDDNENLRELTLASSHPWVDQRIADLNLGEDVLIAIIIRHDESIIPQGDTILKKDDRIVLVTDSRLYAS